MTLDPDELVLLSHLLDPTDRELAKKRAIEAAEADLVGLDAYIKEHPTLDADGFPVDPVAEAFDALYDAGPYGFAARAFDDDSHLAQWDDDPSPYSGTYSEE
jgi:hypothetical protein